MRIAVFEVEPWERAAFDRLRGEHELVFSHEPLSPLNVGEHAGAQVISTFIYSRIDRDMLDQLPGVKLICTRSTGFEHIDIEACRERSITVANVPVYGSNTVAEHVFALLLTLSHKMDQAVERTRRGDFTTKGLQGFDLFGKTMGFIGTGDIGRCAIRIARGFGMHAIAYDVRPSRSAADELGFRYVSFEELLSQSDIISLHVPLTPQTRHMLGQAQFEQMKQGVILINTARGDLIDMRALVRGLAEGRVAGAGLDVLGEEPTLREEAEVLRSVYMRTHDLETLLADHVVLRLRNVVVTPHSAFNTKEAVQRILDTTVGNIASFAGGEPRNLVSR